MFLLFHGFDYSVLPALRELALGQRASAFSVNSGNSGNSGNASNIGNASNSGNTSNNSNTTSTSSTAISGAARALIERLLQRDPAKRATSKEALHHPWMRGDAEAAEGYAQRHTVLDMMRSYNSERRLRVRKWKYWK